MNTTAGPAQALPGQTVQVVIATPDGRAAVKMDAISVTALASHTAKGVETLIPQVGGTNACKDCSSIELPVVPEPTAQLRWNFVFHGLSSGASMFVVH